MNSSSKTLHPVSRADLIGAARVRVLLAAEALSLQLWRIDADLSPEAREALCRYDAASTAYHAAMEGRQT